MGFIHIVTNLRNLRKTFRYLVIDVGKMANKHFKFGERYRNRNSTSVLRLSRHFPCNCISGVTRGDLKRAISSGRSDKLAEKNAQHCGLANG